MATTARTSAATPRADGAAGPQRGAQGVAEVHAEVHAEVEVALDVPEEWTFPDLGGDLSADLVAAGVTGVGEPVEQALDARYLDTPDLRLLAARTTLRRRSGGEDAGWHLKLPRGDGERREVRLPLRGPSVRAPRQLSGLVRALVRTSTLGTVARLRTARRVRPVLGAPGGDGRPVVLAEVADDRVTAEVPSSSAGEPARTRSWRELEVELVEGDRAVLDALVAALEAAGARRARVQSKLRRALEDRLPTPAEEAARGRLKAKSPAGRVWLASVRPQVDGLLALDPAARQDEPDAVHRLRVATRRLRSALATGRPLLDREVTDPLREELGWLAGRLGPLRDAEVARAHLLALARSQPPELLPGPVLARLALEADHAVAQGRRAATAALDDARYLRLLDALVALVVQPPTTPDAERPAREVLLPRAAAAHRRVARAAAAASAEPDPARRAELLRNVRRAAERARYVAEALAPVAGEDAARYAAAVEALQEALGAHHDTVLTRALLRRAAAAAHRAGEDAFGLGRLHALEEARAQRAEEEALRRWDAASRRRLRRWMG